MNPDFIDPNNHVPEVSPADGWDDAEGFDANAGPAATILPQRRTISERAAVAAVDPLDSPGLRIEPNVARKEAGDTESRLEIQEITGSVIRLEQAEPGPEKVARTLVFHERPTREDPSRNPKGEGSDWGDAQKFSWHWILLIGTGVSAVIVLALMLLPHWTDGCIGSSEGLFFEASGTTPYHFVTTAAMSESSSNPVRQLRYDNNNAALGVPFAERGRAGERYILGGENLTGAELMKRIARIVGGVKVGFESD